MSKQFASRGDLEPKAITFEALAEGVYAYTAEGDPNSGVIIGDDSVIVVDTQATPTMAQALIERIRALTDKPIRYLVLTHYPAVRVLGASVYGAEHIIASRGTYELIAERGQQDYDSELGRFPRLFQDADSIRWYGCPRRRCCSAAIWWSTGLCPTPGTPTCATGRKRSRACAGWARRCSCRGAALTAAASCEQAIAGTQASPTDLFESVRRARQSGKLLKVVYDEVYSALQPKYGHWVIFDHCMPFDISRAYDESGEYPDPRIWAAERDQAMWQALESG